MQIFVSHLCIIHSERLNGQRGGVRPWLEKHESELLTILVKIKHNLPLPTLSHRHIMNQHCSVCGDFQCIGPKVLLRTAKWSMKCKNWNKTLGVEKRSSEKIWEGNETVLLQELNMKLIWESIWWECRKPWIWSPPLHKPRMVLNFHSTKTQAMAAGGSQVQNSFLAT